MQPAPGSQSKKTLPWEREEATDALSGNRQRVPAGVVAASYGKSPLKGGAASGLASGPPDSGPRPYLYPQAKKMPGVQGRQDCRQKGPLTTEAVRLDGVRRGLVDSKASQLSLRKRNIGTHRLDL